MGKALTFTSDGSVEESACEAARGSYGWVARSATDDEGWGDFSALLAGAGRVQGQWWEHTSTRAEAAGLLDAVQAALGLRRKHGALLRADFALDNEAVVKQCQTLLRWSPLRWLKCSDRDVWRCLADAMRRLAGAGVHATVRWIRSHPEGRHAHAAWSRDDVANHLADRWANKAQSLPDTTLTYNSGRAWDVTYEGAVVTGPLRKSLKAILMETHLRKGLRAAGRAPEEGDMDWTLVRRCLAGVRKDGLGMLVWWTKALGNILAT